MKIAIVRERADGETRVAATPETVGKLIALGASVAIEAGAGASARFPDADYAKAGATVGSNAEVVKDADIAVQERLRLVFEMFLELTTVAKVMRMLNERGLDLPRRDRHGDLCWTRATVSSVAAILKNPAYAGAFVYGRTRMRTSAREGVSRAKAPRPIEEWRIVVKDRYPAYIDWPTYEKFAPS